MSTTAERVELRRTIPTDVALSAWIHKWGLERASRLLGGLSTPLVLFVPVFYFWYAAMYFVAPIDLSIVPKTISMTQMFIGAVHFMFLVAALSYIAAVLFHVPWGDRRFPLIAVPDFHYLRWAAFHLLVLGAIALLKTRQHNLQGYLILAEGTFLLYCSVFQPAFGFVPWTYRDKKAFESQSPQANAQAIPTNTTAVKEEKDETYAVPFQAKPSPVKFANIHGMVPIKERMLEAAKRILAPHKAGEESPRNGVLLFGEPGNGKTVFAQALAGEMAVPFIEVTYGAMSSQWVGNMPRVIANTFAYAKRCAPCVLFIDEFDSFIKSRGAAGGSSEDLKITNTLLTEIVNLRGHAVILMAATNYLDHLDAAAIREGRFDFKIEVTPPDEEARIGLIRAGIAKYAAGLHVVEQDALSVAKRWNGFSVARLMAVCKALEDVAQKQGFDRIELAQWMAALREVQGRKGKLPGDTKLIADLILDTDTRAALDLIASRLQDVARIELLGGTLPTGVLFHGPSGTGKTVAARALAKQVGWAFLSIAGPDLIADRSKLDKLFSEAKDIRPTLVFIDEADDILRNRQYSSTPDLVNKLLTIMDGAEDKIKDVVWIAATNNPEQIDPALLRSGRFTEKVLFTTPPQDQIPRHISAWLEKREVSLDAQLDVIEVAKMLAGQTIADVEGVIQYALNSSIARTLAGFRPIIDRRDMAQAIRVVLNKAND